MNQRKENNPVYTVKEGIKLHEKMWFSREQHIHTRTCFLSRLTESITDPESNEDSKISLRFDKWEFKLIRASSVFIGLTFAKFLNEMFPDLLFSLQDSSKNSRWFTIDVSQIALKDIVNIRKFIKDQITYICVLNLGFNKIKPKTSHENYSVFTHIWMLHKNGQTRYPLPYISVGRFNYRIKHANKKFKKQIIDDVIDSYKIEQEDILEFIIEFNERIDDIDASYWL